MAKRLRRKRSARGAIPAIKKVLLSRKASVVLIVVVILITCVVLVRNYIYNSPEFIVKEIELRGDGVEDSHLSEELSNKAVDENIFSVNINRIARSIKDDYFEVKNISVERIFPDKLVFHVEKRKAIALISSRYYYPVDEEGVILKGGSKNRSGDLPVITGIYLREKDIGRTILNAGLEKSLTLLNELSKSGVSDSYNISSIDADNSRNLSFYIDDGVQIKIGGDDFRARLRNLKKVLEDPEVDLKDIRYVDLRFKDVIIGPK